MTTTAKPLRDTVTDVSVVLPVPPQTLDEFLVQYADISDGYKYEWNDGIIEKTRKMNQEQASIQHILMNLFIRTKLFKAGGFWAVELDMRTSKNQLRRPDLAIYTAKHLVDMQNGQNQIPIWVGKVISKHDEANHIFNKLKEYFDAGVQVVWHIFPSLSEVHVYTSAEKGIICREDAVCSATPALEDFEISVNALFKRLKNEG